MGVGQMKGLVTLFCFALPLSLLCLLFNLTYDEIAAPRIPAGAKILILGDSHALSSLDPARIGRTANLSGLSENYLQNYYKFKYALEIAPRLRTVILPIDLHSFSDYRCHRVFFEGQWQGYLDYRELGTMKKKPLFFLREYIKLRFFGFRGKYREFLMHAIPDLGDDPSSVGRGFQPGNAVSRRAPTTPRAVAVARIARQLKDFNPFCPEMVFYFDRMLDLARRNNMNIVLLRFPITPEYASAAASVMAVERYYQRVREITADYPRVYFLDKHRMFQPGRTVFFADSDHLNAKGAQRFSDEVRRDLIQMNLLEPGKYDLP